MTESYLLRPVFDFERQIGLEAYLTRFLPMCGILSRSTRFLVGLNHMMMAAEGATEENQ